MLARGAGKSLAIVGRSRVLTVNWKAPPELAQPGHYEGKSSQNEKFAFDVTADGQQVVDLVTGPINTSARPAPRHRANLSLPGPYPITADHTFSISIKNQAIVSQKGEPINRSISIAGRFAGAIASGSLLVEYEWPSLGGLARAVTKPGRSRVRVDWARGRPCVAEDRPSGPMTRALAQSAQRRHRHGAARR